MGKGDKDRKAYKASSSAQAAEFLASRAGGGAGAGFGGFSGSAPVLPGATAGFAFGASAAARLAPTVNTTAAAASAGPTAAASASADIQLSGQLDGDIAQCLRHLTKKDSVTKLKALQTFRALIQEKPPTALGLALPPWVFLYQRLAADSSRSVRTEAATTLGQLVGQIGKAAMPQLKSLMGPWWLAQFDPHADAANAARSSFQTCFPGKKQSDALLFCCQELVNFLIEQATANAQQLGDARKDTPEEMEERHERVVSASLLALGTLLHVITSNNSQQQQPPTTTTTTTPTSSSSKQQGQVWAAVSALLSKPGYVKSCIGSKSHLIRSATYSFIQEVVTCVQAAQSSSSGKASTGPDTGAQHTPEGSTAAAAAGQADTAGAAAAGQADTAVSGQQELTAVLSSVLSAAGGTEVAGAVLGAVSDKEAGGHGLMWAMLLSYIKVFPGCWEVINIRKMFLPRLTAFLRHGCFGSHTVSWPSLLPLISLMPKSVTLSSVEIPVQLLEATWAGLLEPSAAREGRAAGCAAYIESLQWLLVVGAQQVSSQTVAAGSPAGADVYRQELLQKTVAGKPLEAALGVGEQQQAAQDAGQEVLVGLIGRLAKGAAQQQQQGGSASTAASSAAASLLAAQTTVEAALLTCIRNALETDPPSDLTFTKCEKLLASIKTASPETAQALAAAVIRELVAAMHSAAGGAGSTQLPAAASQLLAVLIRTTPVVSSATADAAASGTSTSTATTTTATATGQPQPASAAARQASLTDTATGAPPVSPQPLPGLGLDTLLSTCMSSPLDSPSTSAHVHVLVSWLLSSATPAQDWLSCVSTFTGLQLVTDNPTENELRSELSSSGLHRGLQLCQLLVNCLVEVWATSPDVATTQAAWQPVLDSLACALSSPEAFAQLAASFVLPVQPGSTRDTTRDMVQHVTGDAAVQLLVALVTGCNTASAHLLSSTTVAHVMQQVVSVLAPAGGSGSGSRDAAGLLTVGEFSCEACAALHVGCAYLSACAKQSTARVVPSTATASVQCLVTAIAQLTWYQAASTPSKHTYHSTLIECDVSESGSSEDGQPHDDHVHHHKHHQPLVSLEKRLETDEWLAVALELATATWEGLPLVHVASQQLPETVFTSLAADLSAVLVAYVQPAGSASVHQACAMVAARAQEVTQTLGQPPASRASLLAFVQQLLEHARLALSAPEQSNTITTTTALLARDAQLSLAQLKLPLLLAHVVHALGVEVVVAAAPDSLPAAHVVVHLLCAESAIGLQPATVTARGKSVPGPQGVQEVLLQQHVLQVEVPSAAGALVSHLSEQAVDAAVQLLYNGACGRLVSSTSLNYAQYIWGNALSCWLDHVSSLGNLQGRAVIQRFTNNHLLPAATALQQGTATDQLPHDVMLSVLSRVATVLRGAGSSQESVPVGLQTSFSQVAVALITWSLSLTPVTLSPTLDIVRPLQAATACFPITLAPHVSSPDAAVTGPAARMTCTSQEAGMLLKLLKHQVVRRGAVAAVSRAGGSPVPGAAVDSPLTSETVQEGVAKLGLVAVSYCGSQLQAAEWHTLLSDMQACLTDVVTCVRNVCVSRLGPALKTAAQSLLGDSQQGPMSGLVAVQLLRQLDQRGVLSKHPAHATLVDDVSTALADVNLPASLQPVLQSIRVLLKQLQDNSSVKLDQLPEGIVIFQQKYRSLFADVCEQLLQFVLALGFANCLASVGGGGTSDVMTTWMAGHSETLETAGAATCGFLHLSVRPGGAGLVSAAYSALSHTDAWADTLDMGLTALDSMLSLALQPPSTDTNHQGATTSPAHMLSAAAYISLLHAPESVTSRLTVPVEDDQSGDLPEYEQGTDPINYLIHAGLHPHLAASVAGGSASTSFRSQLVGWAVLLPHLVSAPAASTAPRVVRQALGEIPQLLPTFLHNLLKCLPVAEYSASSRNAAARRANSASSAALSTSDSGAGGRSGPVDLRTALRDAGYPTDEAMETATGRVLFGGVLHVMPASARTWFGDLRDRGTALAVEAYTAAIVSPQLLAMEMQDVQARGSELKSDQFSIRVNSSAREVVAQMVVEEGSSLELAIKLPTSLPLKPPEVECRKRVGVNDTRMRKWLLSISSFLRINNRGVADAINMWRTNVESEFAGVEPCLICYSVVAPTNSALPRLQCHTCQVRFHPGCLYKWFKSSGKSVCPHCQSPW